MCYLKHEDGAQYKVWIGRVYGLHYGQASRVYDVHGKPII